ncbi:hypothetical protein MKD49_05385 [Herbaspirillum sp. WGmk3]|uniref:hypothetical protein n=1 Tax=Herbaspirillum sp. WGmk3 TaxID=2919925 RepID=UPI002090CE0B|nr:hypothetical protein [Herbaspirillum sp. WGmk3]MCO4855914.1 hypothetical protein [Herbaspirillum sp. WGmk3]
MDNMNNYHPLIRFIPASKDMPRCNIDDEVASAFHDCAKRLDPNRLLECEVVLRLLDCFLQVTGSGQLSLARLQTPDFARIYVLFAGALYSERFLSVRISRSTAIFRIFERYVDALREQYPTIPTLKIKRTYRAPLTQSLIECVAKFEEIEWVEERAYVWHGWAAQNGNGRLSFFQFHPIYLRLGREFTDQLHSAYRLFVSGRRDSPPLLVKELARFISTYEGELTPAHFKSPSFMTEFWRKFALFFVSEVAEKGQSVVVAISTWRRRFVSFAKNYLEAPGIVARTLGDFPCPPKRHPVPAHTHIKIDPSGAEVKTKLLTPVPLHVTDTQAMEILFQRIEKDLNTVIQWARHEISDIWARYTNRIQLAKLGTARTINLDKRYKIVESEESLVALENPMHLANACATFEKHGYLHIDDIAALHRIYPLGSSEMARLFALPTTIALFPHCTLLTALHPKITSSFLERLELYSPSGQMIGHEHTNDTHYLVSVKPRIRDDTLKEQRIELTAESNEVVRQIIELTMPLRTYLKKKGKDEWRFLLLSCGEGFGRPCSVPPLSAYASRPERHEPLLDSFMTSTGASREYANELLEHFSVAKVRASSGLLVFLRTGDMRKMAEALGHKKLSANLLDHYLPRPIRDFFQERWIRVFQQALVVEALQDSEYVLKATRFSNMNELNEFLSNHALNMRGHSTTRKASRITTPTADEVIISVNTAILTALVSLESAVSAAVRPPNLLAEYWANVTRRLVAFIESKECHRSDLRDFLSRARAAASPDTFCKIIHE